MHLLNDNIEVRLIGAAIAAASNTDANSARIDMAGYESVMIVAGIATSAATGVATVSIRENDVDSDSGMTAVTGASVAATSAALNDLNDRFLYVDYFRPSKRFIHVRRQSATANIAYGQLYAILVPYQKPVIPHTTRIAGAAVAN